MKQNENQRGSLKFDDTLLMKVEEVLLDERRVLAYIRNHQ